MTTTISDTNNVAIQSLGLTREDVAEFQTLLARECNLRLDTPAAWKRSTQLVNLVRMLLGPIPEDPQGIS